MESIALQSSSKSVEVAISRALINNEGIPDIEWYMKGLSLQTKGKIIHT